MNDPTTTNSSSAPQFATAEYASPGGAETCKSCNKPISGSYYRVNGSLACTACVSQLQNQIPRDSHSAFVRSLIFGSGGAVLGLILYSAFGIITGLAIGYLSLAVGYIVGKAIRMGSGGVGGRRYQVAAVALTYFAVSMSAVPIALYEFAKAAKEKPRPVSSSTSDPASGGKVDSETDGPADPEAKSVAKDNKPGISVEKLIGTLLFYGLASPFLELQNPINGALGIVILLVGIRIAWRLTGAPQIDILGPFEAKPASA
jgi:hypothetical protein